PFSCQPSVLTTPPDGSPPRELRPPEAPASVQHGPVTLLHSRENRRTAQRVLDGALRVGYVLVAGPDVLLELRVAGEHGSVERCRAVALVNVVPDGDDAVEVEVAPERQAAVHDQDPLAAPVRLELQVSVRVDDGAVPVAAGHAAGVPERLAPVVLPRRAGRGIADRRDSVLVVAVRQDYVSIRDQAVP